MFTKTLLVFVLLIFPLRDATAQSLFGTILGTLTDTTGAVVPRGQIRVKNTATGAVRTTVANESGDYQVPTLPVGQYEVTVEASGFKRALVASVTLAVDLNYR